MKTDVQDLAKAVTSVCSDVDHKNDASKSGVRGDDHRDGVVSFRSDGTHVI